MLDKKMNIFDEEVVHVLKTSIPLVVVELISSLYSLTDTYFVKNLGENAIAALGISGYIFWFVSSFFALFHTPLSIILAQYIGGKEFEKARAFLGYIIVIGGIFVIAMTFALAYYTPLIVALQSNAQGTTFSYAVEYLQIRFYGLLVSFISMALDIGVISTGKTLYSMISNSVGLVLNAVLDPLMIYGLYGFPQLGVAGAAYATILSQSISAVLSTTFLSRLNLVPVINFSTLKLKKVLSLGFFAFVERFFFSFGNNVYAGVIARLGDEAMAAHSIGLRIESLIYMPGIAFSTTASVLVGQNVGASNLGKAHRIGLKVIKLSSIIMGSIGIAIACLSNIVVQPFAPSEAVRRLSSLYLVIAGLNEFGLGLAMTASGAIRGAGNVIIPFSVNLSCLFLIRVTLSILLAPLLGVLGPWLAMFIDVYVRGISLFYIFKFKFHKFAKKVV